MGEDNLDLMQEPSSLFEGLQDPKIAWDKRVTNSEMQSKYDASEDGKAYLLLMTKVNHEKKDGHDNMKKTWMRRLGKRSEEMSKLYRTRIGKRGEEMSKLYRTRI